MFFQLFNTNSDSDSDSDSDSGSNYWILVWVVWGILAILPLYLWRKCKNRHPLGFLPAVLVPPSFLFHHIVFYKICNFATIPA